MSGITVTINTEDAITPRLQALYRALGDDRKTAFLEAMGLPVAEVVSDRLAEGEGGARP